MSGGEGPTPGFVFEQSIEIDPETGEQLGETATVREVADINAVFDEERG